MSQQKGHPSLCISLFFSKQIDNRLEISYYILLNPFRVPFLEHLFATISQLASEGAVKGEGGLC
jgi:hypothetical protein